MFPERTLFSSLNITRLIGGLNRTLTVAKELIPIYREAKPLISNAKNAISTFKNITNKAPKIVENAHNNVKPLKEKIITIKSDNSNYNNPTFFQ